MRSQGFISAIVDILKILFNILMVCGVCICWNKLEVNQTSVAGAKSFDNFIETSHAVYEYVSKPHSYKQAEKYCEYKFASLLSETRTLQDQAGNLVQFPIWLKEEKKPELRPLTALVFEQRTDTKYAKLMATFPSFHDITVCAHIQWDNTSKDFETVFSYAVKNFINEFQLRGMSDEDGFVRFAVIIHGQHSGFSSIFSNDGQWHHICITWQRRNETMSLYADGGWKVSSKISASEDIIMGGIFIIGQDQDSYGGTFKEKESFSGNITSLNVWAKVLSQDQIQRLSLCHKLEQDIVFGWTTHKLEIEPTLKKLQVNSVCSGNSAKCQILQNREGDTNYTTCWTELPFVCNHQKEVYKQFQNAKTTSREQSFANRVNMIANRSVIPENPLTSDITHFTAPEALECLQAIERGLEMEISPLDSVDVLGIIQFLKEVSDVDIQDSKETLEELSHHFVQVTGELLEQHDPEVWSEVTLIIKGPMTIIKTVEKMACSVVQLLSDKKKEVVIHHKNIEIAVSQVDLNVDRYIYKAHATEKVDEIEVLGEDFKKWLEEVLNCVAPLQKCLHLLLWSTVKSMLRMHPMTPAMQVEIAVMALDGEAQCSMIFCPPHERNTLDKVMQILEEMHGDPTNIGELRMQLFHHVQREGESVTQYINALQEVNARIAKLDDVGAIGVGPHDVILRDQFVAGLWDAPLKQALQERLRTKPRMTFLEIGAEARMREQEQGKAALAGIVRSNETMLTLPVRAFSPLEGVEVQIKPTSLDQIPPELLIAQTLAKVHDSTVVVRCINLAEDSLNLSSKSEVAQVLGTPEELVQPEAVQLAKTLEQMIHCTTSKDFTALQSNKFEYLCNGVTQFKTENSGRILGVKGVSQGSQSEVAVVNTWSSLNSFQHVFGDQSHKFIHREASISDGGYKHVGTYLGSSVISSTVLAGERELSTSVQYYLWHSEIPNSSIKLRTNPVCVFWDFSIGPESGGGWSTDGCQIKNTFPHSTSCFCNHTTNFAVLLQVYDVQRSEEEEWILRTLTFIGCGVSLSALVVTFILFLVVGVPKSERTTVHKNLIFALAAAETLLMFSEIAKKNKVSCVTVTAGLHLFYMAAFAWMLVEGLLLWSKVVAVNMSEDRRMKFYYITGWGLPLIIVSVTLASSFNKYLADTHCWLNIHSDIIWAFVGPVLFILTVNTFVLFRVVMVTVSSARRRSKMLTPNCSLEKQIGIQVWATAKPIIVLLPVLGLTWLCGVLVHINVIWAYVFIFLNAFQGLYIFLIYAIYNSEVRNAIQRIKEKKKALSFTNCSQPTNYICSPRNTTLDIGKPYISPPKSNLSYVPSKISSNKGHVVSKQPVNIYSILSTDNTAVELTSFKASGC
ncbi:adhesion G protein-coupled receptor D2 [Dendrobates tinctorius]|uniref:adhesion G protein-coupled receptor D2 n=1 Tax=Dendrobates tinctorius TaxID=92724 RepID=UPI003CC980D8